MDVLVECLDALREIHASGSAVEETSYYPPLARLLNEVGKSLSPRVRCIINLRNRGAGLPDGGFFTPDQLRSISGAEPTGGLPARGALEVKGASDDAWATVEGEQVARYLRTYRQVLVTNLRDFVLVGVDGQGKPAKLESYSLAADAAAFWRATGRSEKTAALHSAPLTEFLKRVLLHRAALTSAKELAWFLASYARDAKARIEGVPLPALDALRGLPSSCPGAIWRMECPTVPRSPPPIPGRRGWT